MSVEPLSDKEVLKLREVLIALDWFLESLKQSEQFEMREE